VKFDAFEWALEKATELGVTRIVPLACCAQRKGAIGGGSQARGTMDEILLEASQQSRRVSVPLLEPLAKPEVAFAWKAEALRVFLSEAPEPSPCAWCSPVSSRGPPFWRLGRKAGGRTRSLPPGAARSFRRLRSASSSSVPRPPSSRRLLR